MLDFPLVWAGRRDYPDVWRGNSLPTRKLEEAETHYVRNGEKTESFQRHACGRRHTRHRTPVSERIVGRQGGAEIDESGNRVVHHQVGLAERKSGDECHAEGKQGQEQGDTCGLTLASGTKFCTRCGTRLEAS
jgi:hypothetical protein